MVCKAGARPFFKSLFVYRVFLRFESQLSTATHHDLWKVRGLSSLRQLGPDEAGGRAKDSRSSK